MVKGESGSDLIRLDRFPPLTGEPDEFGGVVAFKQDVWLKTAVGKDLITEAAQRGIAVHQYKGLVTDLV